MAASCQASKAFLEASLQSEAVEATLWQASALAGAAYAVVQHVARPLWARHFETEFPLDRFVLVLYCCVINIIYFSSSIKCVIYSMDIGVQALHLADRPAGPDPLQLPGAVPAPGVCLHCLNTAGPGGSGVLNPSHPLLLIAV